MWIGHYLHLSSFFSRCSQTLLLSPLCFHCCQEGSVIKLPFLSLPLHLTVLVSSCRGGGGGVLSAPGDCFTRGYRKVRSKNQWGNSSAASNSISASQDPLRGIGISRAPKGRIINMTDRGMKEEDGGEGERCRWGEMWDVQVFFKTVLSRILSSSPKQPPPKPSFVATCAHHKNGGPCFLPNFSGSNNTCVDVQRAGAL